MNTDNLLLLFGIVLTLVGVALFTRSKVSGENSMSLLGMKVRTSHPSLFIFFSGIVLILAPRLLPNGNSAQPNVNNRSDSETGPVNPSSGSNKKDCDETIPRRIEVANIDRYLSALGRVLDRGCDGSTYVVANNALDLNFALQLQEHFREKGVDCRAYSNPNQSNPLREYACSVGGRWQVVEGDPFDEDIPLEDEESVDDETMDEPDLPSANAFVDEPKEDFIE